MKKGSKKEITKYPRIAELRKSQERSKLNVATHTGIEQSYYTKMENGTINVSLDNLIKIADFYEVSIDYLIERTNRKEVNK